MGDMSWRSGGHSRQLGRSAGGGLDDGGPTSPFLLGGVPSSPSPDDKGRSGSGGGGVPGGVGPLLPTAQPPAFPLLGGKQPGGFPLSLLYGQPSSYLLVGSAPFMPLPPQGDLTRGLLFPPLHAGFDPLAKERMASCLDLAARSYAHQRPGSKGGADGRNPLLSAPTLPFPWRGPHLDMMGGSDGAGGSPPPFGQDRGGSPSKGLDLKRADHLAGSLGSPKWSLGQATSCPVCGVTLAQAQMADHFQLEMDKLADFYSCRRWVDRSHEEASLPEPQVQCRPSYDAGKRSPLSRWETYLKVRGNRHQRLNALCGRRRRAELPLDLQSADGSPPGTPHGRGPPPPPPSLKVELSDNAYDHEGARGGGGSKDPMLRSPATGSFSESGEQSRDRQTPGAPGHGSPVTGEGGQGCALAAEPGSEPCADDGTPSDLRSGTADETIRWKCVVCSEPYRTPLVSVCCWHVHCERCWLQTLGSKRLCPQCDAVTCPSDLRKIYL